MASKRTVETLKLLLAGYNLYVRQQRSDDPRAFTMHPHLCEAGPDVPYAVVRTLIDERLIEGQTLPAPDGDEVGTYWLAERGVQTLRHHAIGLKNYAETLLTTIDRSEWGKRVPLDRDR